MYPKPDDVETPTDAIVLLAQIIETAVAPKLDEIVEQLERIRKAIDSLPLAEV